MENAQSDNLPGYIGLYESGVLEERIESALRGLESCKFCPWNCGINRLADEKKVCRTGRYARVTSHFPHHGEEACLRGWNGSGTIFFGRCNLRCVFCQNYEISQRDAGSEVNPEQLARMMLELQENGCHNINFVTPEHLVPQVLEALPIAIEEGLNLPLVYNTSAFDSKRSLQLLDGIIDIYMPDFKYWNREKSKKYLKTPKYPETARSALREMHHQVGVLKTNNDGVACRGLLVRHPLMPNGEKETEKILQFIASEISVETTVNIMGQYRPAGKVDANKYPELNRPVSRRQMLEAVRYATQAGLLNLI
ncbi:MAG: hypothetical protein MAGBODY4_00976 [Candidatus Marinimicrobia bacterium]|nr:hypothetical protein [Candidatus Neomarinimicrobiota bacterium]